jgi:hypothetical protein
MIRTAAEAKLEYVERMGADLGCIYHALWQHIARVHQKWGEYVELFGQKPSRVELLNRAAPSFFRIVQDALFDDVLLSIARLTDPPKSVGRGNLTLLQLPRHIADAELRDRVSVSLEEAKQRSDFCRDWRNRRIAHADLALSLESAAEPLKVASRQKVADALKTIEATMNAVSAHYLESTTFFESSSASGGSLSVLYLLDDGLRARESRRDAIKQGSIEALRPREL